MIIFAMFYGIFAITIGLMKLTIKLFIVGIWLFACLLVTLALLFSGGKADVRYPRIWWVL